jgi:hypothetical protein
MTSKAVATYRELLKCARNLTAAQQKVETIQRIRTEFRDNRNESDKDKINELLNKAESSLGYLKIITPKRIGNKQSGFTKLVFGEKAAEQQGKAVSNWTGSNMDPDSVKRHYQGLKRAGFRDNSHAKGFF